MKEKEIHILIIDDNDNDVSLCSNYLENGNISVRISHVRRAEEAIQKLNTHKYNICLVDVHLPGMGGIDFIRHILDHGDNLPTIVLTDKGDEKTAVNALKLGAYDYLLKNELDQVLLNKTINRAIKEHTVRKEKERLQAELEAYSKELEKMVAERTRQVEHLSSYKELILANLDLYVRVVDPFSHAVQYESGKIIADFGANKGETCYSFWEQNKECENCTGKTCLKTQRVEIKEEPSGTNIYSVTSIPLKNMDGSMSVIEVIRDITERKRAEEKQEKLMHDMGERVKELNCLYEVNRLIAEFDNSKRDIFQEIVNLMPPSWQYPEITCARIAYKKSDYRTDNFRKTEWHLASPIMVFGENAGRIEVYYLSEKPVIDEGPFLSEERSLIEAIAGQTGHFIERKQAEKQLKQKSRLAAMGEMSSHLGHEIRNPLHKLGLCYELLKESPEVKGSERELVNSIGKSLEVLFTMANDLLDYSRKDNLSREEVDILQLVRVVTSELSQKLEKNRINLSLDLPSGQINLNIDRLKIHQVLVNVINNGIQAMPKGGELGIDIKGKNELLELILTDSGCGISEENIEKIFIPFFTTKTAGTGLGMPIVKHFIELHGGDLCVKSKEGKGTAVTITLPI